MIDEKLRESKTNAQWANVKLTPIEDNDIDTLYEWQNAPNIRDLIMGFRFPIQKETIKDWVKSIREQNSKSRVVFAIRNKSALAGTIYLHNIDHYQRKSLLGIYVGNTNERNHGIGSITTTLLLDYAFNGLDFRKVGLEVLSTNMNAIRLYEKLGFVREGLKRKDYFIDGRYLDTYIYGILREEFDINIPSDAHRLIYSVCKT